jgi:hypothetical protein
VDKLIPSDHPDRDLNAMILNQLVDDIRDIQDLAHLDEETITTSNKMTKWTWATRCRDFARAHRHLYYERVKAWKEEGVEYLLDTLGLDINAVRDRLRADAEAGMRLFRRLWPLVRPQRGANVKPSMTRRERREAKWAAWAAVGKLRLLTRHVKHV